MRGLRLFVAVIFTAFITVPVYLFSSVLCMVFGVLALKPKSSFKLVRLTAICLFLDTLHFVNHGFAMVKS